MGINVYSEMGNLKKVLLHRPGDEFLNLTPNTLERLLFDDIPDERSFMHLDTVLTRVDVNKFTVHSQVMQITKVFDEAENRMHTIKNLFMQH